MRELVDAIDGSLRTDGTMPPGEKDVIIAGDFNADRFDGCVETFWDDMQKDGWHVLAESAELYSSTRLAGNPPGSKTSRIDYIIISKGLAELEVLARNATVHKELVGNAAFHIRNGYDCRVKASDHLPVTVNVAVVKDDD